MLSMILTTARTLLLHRLYLRTTFFNISSRWAKGMDEGVLGNCHSQSINLCLSVALFTHELPHSCYYRRPLFAPAPSLRTSLNYSCFPIYQGTEQLRTRNFGCLGETEEGQIAFQRRRSGLLFPDNKGITVVAHVSLPL